jgi:hypothetical protein
MTEMLRIAALAVVFGIAAVAWGILGGVMTARTSQQESELVGQVAGLWGQPLDQQAPTLSFQWVVPVEVSENVVGPDNRVLLNPDGTPMMRKKLVNETRTLPKTLASTDIDVALGLDQRRKGLMWFSLYDVGFEGAWTYEHEQPEAGTLWLTFAFPVPDGMYDGFHFTVNGEEVADKLVTEGSQMRYPVAVAQGDRVAWSIGYAARGLDRWTYRPTSGASQIADFRLGMTTDFADIDYPPFTISPSSRARTDTGWKLDWEFARLVTGHGMGMAMPTRIQPGPLAAEMAFSAPISLGLFMLWIYVLGLLKGIDIHPVNHLFLAGAFFAFHLLFGYSCDHLPVEWAFALSSAVSVALVVSYLRLVVGAKFASREAGLAQLLYLVGFSLAHFWEGYTGLTVTILGIATLFALMQLTGRIKWSEVFRNAGAELNAPAAVPTPPALPR